MPTITAAGVAMPADYKVSVTDAAGKDAWPIASFTYLLVYSKMDANKGPKLVKFLNWAMAEGQKMAEPMDYAPLPKSMIPAVEARIDPSQDQSRLGTSLSKSLPLGEQYSLTLKNGYNLIQQGFVPVPGIVSHHIVRGIALID